MTPSLEPKIGVENNLGVWVNHLKQDKETAGQKSKMNTASSHPKISSSHLGDRILFKPPGRVAPGPTSPWGGFERTLSSRMLQPIFGWEKGVLEYSLEYWSIGVLEY